MAEKGVLIKDIQLKQKFYFGLCNNHTQSKL